MCSHYQAVTAREKLRRRFGIELPPDLGKTGVWPGSPALMIKRPREADAGDEAVPEREATVGQFGLLPHWAKDEKFGRRTFNARSETASTLPSFRDACKKSWYCIIPADAVYEPDWRSGKAAPTRISRADGEPMGIAGLWSIWHPKDREPIYSFTMLTIPGAGHGIMQNMHRPDDEKRMVVILPDAQYAAWLNAAPADSGKFLQQFPAEKLIAMPAAKA